jgi:hypothetical protein
LEKTIVWYTDKPEYLSTLEGYLHVSKGGHFIITDGPISPFSLQKDSSHCSHTLNDQLPNNPIMCVDY